MSNLIFKGSSLKGIVKKAKEILFDNSASGLSATDVQGAIEEINNELSEYKSKLLKIISVDTDVTVAGNGRISPAISLPSVDGYTPIAIAQVEPKGANYIFANILQASFSDKIYLTVGNSSSSEKTITICIKLLMMKNV